MKSFHRFFFLSVFILSIISSGAVLGAEERFHLLYFFSATCPHCKQATPVVSDLSRRYPVQGILFGKESPGQLPFSVKQGSREERERYSIRGIPTLVVLRGETVKYAFVGDRSIKDAGVLLRGFESGALTVTELEQASPSGETIVAGWLQAQGDYFSDNSRFTITDRISTIQVTPWLPKEAVKSRLKQLRPRLMSDVVDKPVVLVGRLKTEHGNTLFQVKGEKTIE